MIPLDLDAAIVIAHSEREQTAPTWKRTFGFHPMCSFIDHGPGGTGEPAVLVLCAGNAGSRTAEDHITTGRLALAQIPVRLHKQVVGGTRDRPVSAVLFQLGGSLRHADAMAYSAWVGVIGSAVTGLAAFGGVALTQRASARRELIGRIWEKRAETYESLIGWLVQVQQASYLPDEEASSVQAARARVSEVSTDLGLLVRVTAYASSEILREFSRFAGELQQLMDASGKGEYPVRKLSWLGTRAEILQEAVRLDLKTGSEERIPWRASFYMGWRWIFLRFYLRGAGRYPLLSDPDHADGVLTFRPPADS